MSHALMDTRSSMSIEHGDAATNDEVGRTSPTWPAEPPQTRREAGPQISPTYASPGAIAAVLAALACLILWMMRA